MNPTEIEGLELVESLASKRCPACGGLKKRKHTFCGGCYFKLPGVARQNLYRRLGSGYREAVLVALETLGKGEFILPEAP